MVVTLTCRSLVLAGVLAVAWATVARAEEGCGPLADITKQLSEGKYHEAPVAHAMADAGTMLIVHASASGATWTLVGVRANSASIGCLLAAGTDWQLAPPPLPGRPS